jgi:hypothetical protein
MGFQAPILFKVLGTQYFAMCNAHFIAHISHRKIRLCIIHKEELKYLLSVLVFSIHSIKFLVP